VEASKQAHPMPEESLPALKTLETMDGKRKDQG